MAGAGDHRRGAPLRRAPERTTEGAARAGRCADAHRHADSAHAGLALEGLRDFSVIATAPQKRLAIKTFVRREEDGVIREAALRELKRGGQVYFLHNEVET